MPTRTARAFALTASGTVATAGLVGLVAAPASGLPAPLVQAVATASPTATATATASASATATATASPSGAPSECSTPTALVVPTPVTVAGRPVALSVSSTPGSTVRLFAHSAPSTSYTQVREATVPVDGQVSFSVHPPTNTSLYAQQVGCDPSESVVVGARTAVGISAVREGVRRYTFSGGTLPRRGGQLVSLYRVTDAGSEVLTARTRTTADGRWSIDRAFTGSGRFGFVARTAQDGLNLPGSSAVRPTLVF